MVRGTQVSLYLIEQLAISQDTEAHRQIHQPESGEEKTEDYTLN